MLKSIELKLYTLSVSLLLQAVYCMLPHRTLQHPNLKPQFLPGYKDTCTWKGQKWARSWSEMVSGSEQISAKKKKKQESRCHIKMSPDRTNRLPLPAEHVLISVHIGAFCDTHAQYPWHTYFQSGDSHRVFFPLGITGSWPTGCTYPCSLALERDSEGNTFLKSIYSSLILHSLGYLDFNDAPFVFFTLSNFSKYLALLPVCWLMLIRNVLSLCFHIYYTFLWEAETPLFLFLGHLSLRHAAADYIRKFITICKSRH